MTRPHRSVFAALLLLLLSFPLSATLTTTSTLQLSSDSNEDIEPTVLSYTHFGTEYSMAVWMKSNPTVASNTSVLSCKAWTSNGSVNTGSIPAHPDYDLYYDPVLAKYSGNTAVHLVALGRRIVRDATTNAVTSDNYAILIWRTSNGGVNWTTPVALATDSLANGGGFSLDKPAITTGTTGTIWVSYIRRSAAGNKILRLQAVTYSSGYTWGAPVVPTTPTTVANPQVMVDASYVYVLYMVSPTSSTKGLRMQRYDIAAGTWAACADLTNSTGVYSGGSEQWLVVQASPQIIVRAQTVPIAKIDRARNRISVAWHETNYTGTNSRIAFATFKTNVGVPGAWGYGLVTNPVGSANDINPGMDFDPNTGNYVVTWYAFNGTSVYKQMGTYVQFDAANNPYPETPTQITNVTADAASVTPDANNRRYIGDYHDVSFTNGNWKAVHIIAGSTPDPWAFTLTYP